MHNGGTLETPQKQHNDYRRKLVDDFASPWGYS